MKEVKRIDEWKDNEGNLQEVEIIFTDGTKVKYKADKIEREGNL